jgi:preprotein translocase subunit SecF
MRRRKRENFIFLAFIFLIFKCMDWMSYRKLYFSISGIVIIAGLISMALWGFKIGIDFKGGTIAEYKFENKISTEEATQKLEDRDLAVASIQETESKSYIFKLGAIDNEGKDRLEEAIKEIDPKAEELRFETVGPSIGPELVRKTIYALLISGGAILLWIAYQFKSIRFGTSAVLAMLHDTLVVLGSFSIFGHFFGAEIDFLFASALLTILSFSVHDTIVVYDRIRETVRKEGGSIYDLANKATTETLTRSFNNSITIVFMLLALVLLGGSSIKWFAAALLVGTISGTYSSPFVAVPLLVVWENMSNKFKKK